MDSEHIEKMLLEAAPRLKRVQSIERATSTEFAKTWEVLVAEDNGKDIVFLTVVHMIKDRKLALWAPIGRTKSENKTANYEFMLHFNSLWSKNNGLSIAIEEDGQASVRTTLVIPGLSPVELIQKIEQFVSRVLGLELIMLNGVVPNEANNAQDIIQLEDHAIRI